MSRESDVEDGARKLGAALEDGRGPLGGPCGLRAKEKTDLERMEAATTQCWAQSLGVEGTPLSPDPNTRAR